MRTTRRPGGSRPPGVRYNGNVIAMLLEGRGLLRECGRGSRSPRKKPVGAILDDMTTHDARLPYTRNLRRSGADGGEVDSTRGVVWGLTPYLHPACLQGLCAAGGLLTS